MFDMNLEEDYELGASYRLLISSFPFTSIDISDVVDFPDFDERFAYDGDDLGPIYQKEATNFKVWAPLAESVSLRLIDLNNDEKIIPMVREERLSR